MNHSETNEPKSIVELASRLIECPTAIDQRNDKIKFIAMLTEWFRAHDVRLKELRDSADDVVGLYTELGSPELPLLCLNACGDTAPVGDVRTWSTDPLKATVVDDKLYGRGAADSKIAVSIFSHLIAGLASNWSSSRCRLGLLIDLDEHSAVFGGVKALVTAESHFLGMYLGYPGSESINVGARGFYRVNVVIRGTAQHSGSSSPVIANPAIAAAELVAEIGCQDLAAVRSSDFPMGARVSVTDLMAAGHFTMIPDVADVGIDCRLIPEFTIDSARRLITQAVERVQGKFADQQFHFEFKEHESWPPYILNDDHSIVTALSESAARHFSTPIVRRAVGPSNIGNYLAQHGCPTICGFGVRYENIHAANECVYLDTIPAIHATYRDAIIALAS